MWVMENSPSIKYPVLIQRSARECKCGPRNSISVIGCISNIEPCRPKRRPGSCSCQFVSTISRSTYPSAATAEFVRILYIVHTARSL
ncbi:hypothetical protein PITC_059420 [Penicillium italicum]|uniref:Uncharacterized protein n=1 Tax=Penicillium italicum TaxID=40296 RepID=A0A0A2LEJ7_PENIT|nr:hypothetical protein PITC_059420 [Penicillium italicum]